MSRKVLVCPHAACYQVRVLEGNMLMIISQTSFSLLLLNMFFMLLFRFLFRWRERVSGIDNHKATKKACAVFIWPFVMAWLLMGLDVYKGDIDGLMSEVLGWHYVIMLFLSVYAGMMIASDAGTRRVVNDASQQGTKTFQAPKLLRKIWKKPLHILSVPQPKPVKKTVDIMQILSLFFILNVVIVLACSDLKMTMRIKYSFGIFMPAAVAMELTDFIRDQQNETQSPTETMDLDTLQKNREIWV